MNVLIAGGSGFIGRALCGRLIEKGHRVRVASRTPEKRGGLPVDVDWIELPKEREAWMGALTDCHAVVNLAGAPIADGRWSEDRKALILSSRVETTRGIATACATMAKPPGVLISASAVGYYGDHGDEIGRELKLVDEQNDPISISAPLR